MGIRILILIFSLIISSKTWAMMTNYSMMPDFSEERKALEAQEITVNEVTKIIPVNMQPTNNSTQVASQIVDHSLLHFVNLPEFQRSPLGRTARQVEDSLKTNIEIGGQRSGEIKHKFNFQMQALQRVAQLHYTGFIEAQVQFSLVEQKAFIEILEKLSSGKDLVLNHTQENGINTQNVSIRWHW